MRTVRRAAAMLVAALMVAACGGSDDAPTTTVPDGTTVTRETAVAVNRCFELWAEGQSLGGGAGFVLETDMEALETACVAALDRVDTDRVGVVAVDAPIAELALVLESIDRVVRVARFDLSMSVCDPDGKCPIDPAAMSTFLQLDEVAGDDLPEAFRGFIGFLAPTVLQIEGLTITS